MGRGAREYVNRPKFDAFLQDFERSKSKRTIDDTI